ncbi:hypothetical protein L1987_75936 [Smallanthus sonchifolius]|uniref:Uncharacterized protein n=1 Tax=Smallanthus sonchifolius TaxID=185202 RepID=A0ACB9A6Y2_9ASTR|nr:hypothetical protein L1987_75936 [Smallanthus sonchifolius]
MEETSTPNKKRLISQLIRGRDCTKKLQNLLHRRVVDDGRRWDSDESEKKSAPAVKDRRGCYKRRKTEDSRDKIADTIEDGYAWRKYGQKDILDAKFPRCYYRCTHKDEGCRALKQVQKLEDGSEMFHITYFGFHTCQNFSRNKQMFHITNSGDLSFFLLNSEDFKINHSPSSPSTITNVHLTPSFEKEDDSNTK